MRIEELSRTQWVILAILVGAASAWLHTNWGLSNLTQSHPQTDLDNYVLREPIKSSNGSIYPWIRGITIYPSVEAGFVLHTREGGIKPRKSVVTYQILRASADGKGWMYQDATTLVDDPYRRGFSQPANGTVTEHFAGIAKTRDWIHFRYAWWVEPRYAYPLWIVGSVMVIGIIWPTILSRLVAGGYGRPVKEVKTRRTETSFLKRLFTRAHSGSSSKQAAKPVPMLTQDELNRIAKMEEDLKGFMSTDKDLGGEVGEVAVQDILKLNAGPAPVPTEAAQPDEKKEYDGEFYPTVAHAKKKHEPEQ